jgi:diguanylate cyclase (GGDEF)-like protein
MNILNRLAERINRCAEEVDNRNRINMVLFSKGAILLAVFIVCMSIAIPAYASLLLPHTLVFFYTLFLFVITRYFLKVKYKNIRLMQYLLFAPLLLAGVLVGTYLDPTHQAISIIIFLCLLPLFIIDNPWRVIGYQLFFALVFVLAAYHSKPHDVFMADMVYFPVYIAYIIGINLFSLTNKVSVVENYLLACRAAERDDLTDLLNRSSGELQVETLVKKGVFGSFAIIDIDNFKDFNDKYGHQVGDTVLCEVSKAMFSVFRSSDILWRLGGDEFAVYAVKMLDIDICKQRFTELMLELGNINVPKAGNAQIKVSIGCTIYSQGQLSFAQLYKMSDDALYESKDTGKGKLTIKTV